MSKIPTLTAFSNSPEEGAPDCLCSLCLKLIPEHSDLHEWFELDEPEPYVAVRMWPSHGSYEYRFHDDCLTVALSAGILNWNHAGEGESQREVAEDGGVM